MIKNYRLSELVIAWHNRKVGMDSQVKADLIEAILYGAYPGEKGRTAIREINRLRA